MLWSLLPVWNYQHCVVNQLFSSYSTGNELMTVSRYSLSVSQFPITVKAVFDIYIYGNDYSSCILYDYDFQVCVSWFLSRAYTSDFIMNEFVTQLT